MSTTHHYESFTSFLLLDRITFILKSNFKPPDSLCHILFMYQRERGYLL